MDELESLRADLSAARREYYRTLDLYQARDGWLPASDARAKRRSEMLAAHERYSRAQDRLHDALARRRHAT